ncbi:hypothetical protein [Nitrosopumilus sp.]|uniref:hypothetical protein n=1 Tax=Nitrosopumilus sp. TaxID=2024843 RepID=UPI00247B36A5|nr:hypothetical protein [Nitrosopumilus sp.]MCV0409632.1 hypothetical protein [Nitrosopumilus sp.]
MKTRFFIIIAIGSIIGLSTFFVVIYHDPNDELPVQELSYIPIKESNRQTGDDSCPVIHFVGYAWEDCGSIWTWSILGVPLLMIIVAPIGIALAVVIWRKRK